MQHYLKFRVAFKTLHSILQRYAYKKIIFYIDLPSISRGFYNADVIHLEVDQYIQSHGQMPELFFNEAKEFYNSLLNQFKAYSPYFVTFFDSGKCIQNKMLYKPYKGDRSSTLDNAILEDSGREIFRMIKDYYFHEFVNRFNIPNLSWSINCNDYEADFVPDYLISNNFMNCQSNEVLNVILSTDKDLAQTCRYKNVLMCATVYSRKDGELIFYTLDDDNAISYIYKKFKRGILTAKYIPLILAISGDKADNIPGVKGIGDATAIKLIIQDNIPAEFTKVSPLPSKLESSRNDIFRNYQLTSFKEQLSRIPIVQINKMFHTI